MADVWNLGDAIWRGWRHSTEHADPVCIVHLEVNQNSTKTCRCLSTAGRAVYERFAPRLWHVSPACCARDHPFTMSHMDAADVLALAHGMREVRSALAQRQGKEFMRALDVLLLESKLLNREAKPMNFKPSPEWEPTPNLVPLTTSYSSTFLAHKNIPKVQPYPRKANEMMVVTNAPFINRTTSADSFRNNGAIPRRQPYKPTSTNTAFDIGPEAAGTYTTTSRSTYLPHMVKPYVRASGRRGELAERAEAGR